MTSPFFFFNIGINPSPPDTPPASCPAIYNPGVACPRYRHAGRCGDSQRHSVCAAPATTHTSWKNSSVMTKVWYDTRNEKWDITRHPSSPTRTDNYTPRRPLINPAPNAHHMQDMIQIGRCERMVVIAGDDASGETLLPWIGNGFRALGAASIAADTSDAALPFDARRNGMLLGAGGIGMVLETEVRVRWRVFLLWFGFGVK